MEQKSQTKTEKIQNYCCKIGIYLFLMQNDCVIININYSILTNLLLYGHLFSEYILENIFAEANHEEQIGRFSGDSSTCGGSA